jgi:hypothetical protein
VPLYALALLSLSTLAAAAHTIYTGEQQKPTKVQSFHTDGGPAPATTLEDLWQPSDLVVEGVVVAPPRYVRMPGSGTAVFTEYAFQVLQVFKRDSELVSSDGVITVQRLGGVIDVGSHLEDRTDVNLPRLRKGERYILFLRRLPGENTYTPPTADFVFLVDKNRVVPRGKGPFAQQHAGREADELVTAIRKRGGGK